MTDLQHLITLDVEGSKAWRANIDGVPNLFICENERLEQLLFDRKQLGLTFVHSCRDASKLFLRHLQPLIAAFESDVSELMLLSKGYYYWLHNAFESEYGLNLPINFMATSRGTIDEGGVTVQVHYANLDAATRTLIVGDTVASGETICTGLAAYISAWPDLKTVAVLSYAGSVAGAQRIAAFCAQRNIDVIFLYGLAAFGLAQNGFDLSFLHNETITAAHYRDRAWHAFEGRGISVAGWDFGSQAQAPRKYQMLSRIEAHYWEIPTSEIFVSPSEAMDDKLVSKERAAFINRIPNVRNLR